MNNTERLSAGKGWPLTEIITADDGSQVIYQGRPASNGASTDAPVWCIKRTTVEAPAANTQIITEKYPNPAHDYANSWDDRKTLNYLYF